MGKIFSSISCLVLMLAVVPAQASIDISLDNDPTGQDVVFQNGPYGGGSNHGFTGTINGDTWQAFCVEAGNDVEYITLGTTYRVESTTLTNATATNNFVTDKAKWVYYAFSQGLLRV